MLLSALALMLTTSTLAQTKSKIRTEPLWVKMMDDPNTNYYKAKEEYDRFWKGKEKPMDEEEELMHKGKDEVQEHGKKMSKRERNHQLDMDYYRYQCKRFENWLRVNKAYVQKDGHILTEDERLKIWEQNKNGK